MWILRQVWLGKKGLVVRRLELLRCVVFLWILRRLSVFKVSRTFRDKNLLVFWLIEIII